MAQLWREDVGEFRITKVSRSRLDRRGLVRPPGSELKPITLAQLLAVSLRQISKGRRDSGLSVTSRRIVSNIFRALELSYRWAVAEEIFVRRDSPHPIPI